MPHIRYRRVPANSGNGDEICAKTKHHGFPSYGTLAVLLLTFLGMLFFASLLSGNSSLGFLGDATPSIASRWNKLGTAPSASLVKQALQFVSDRENAYQQAGQHKHWKFRGHGYLHTYRNITLAARIMPMDGRHTDDNMVLGLNQVIVWNVHPARSLPFDQCHLLSIWVRVLGPEIMAGLARSIPAQNGQDCRWDFWVDIQIPGTYQVDAKIILWNGNAPVAILVDNGQSITEGQCPDMVIQSNELSEDALQEAPKMASIMGFKLYQSIGACCEICRRTPHCLYWSTPTKAMPEPTSSQNGCDLYFAANAPDDAIPLSRVLDKVATDQKAAMKEREEAGGQPPPFPPIAWGPSYGKGNQNSRPNNMTAYFLGCGWSFWLMLEFPCLDGGLDDLVYMEQRSFDVGANVAKSAIERHLDLPWCSQQDELFVLHNKREPSQSNHSWMLPGRWVREPWPSPEQCPTPMELHGLSKGTSTRNTFPMEAIDGSHPHCWHRSNLTGLSTQCWESNCEFIEPHHGWESTPLKHEAKFMGVWRNYRCNYMEYNNNQLSECLVKLKIAKLTTWGDSIARDMGYYFRIRTEHLTFYNSSLPDAREVLVLSLQWPHLIWHMNETQYREKLTSLYPSLSNNSERVGIAVSPYLVTSEREQYIHMERAIRFAQVSEEVLLQRGYQMINAFDLSAAFPVRILV
jgi:hypothetical protein